MSGANSALRAIVLDIEGTTTPIAFVYQILFPYVRARLRTFLDSRAPDADTHRVIERLRAEQASEAGAPAPLVQYVEWAMDHDRKSSGLKELQGIIWADGYARGELKGEVFPDVAPALARWHASGLEVAIFSSGSVLAQQLLFRHSNAGDLTPLVRWHFDTATGPKTNADSYRRIAGAIGVPASDALFISDAVAELDAASAAGMKTRLAIRPGHRASASTEHATISSFDEV